MVMGDRLTVRGRSGMDEKVVCRPGKRPTKPRDRLMEGVAGKRNLAFGQGLEIGRMALGEDPDLEGLARREGAGNREILVLIDNTAAVNRIELNHGAMDAFPRAREIPSRAGKRAGNVRRDDRYRDDLRVRVLQRRSGIGPVVMKDGDILDTALLFERKVPITVRTDDNRDFSGRHLGNGPRMVAGYHNLVHPDPVLKPVGSNRVFYRAFPLPERRVFIRYDLEPPRSVEFDAVPAVGQEPLSLGGIDRLGVLVERLERAGLGRLRRDRVFRFGEIIRPARAAGRDHDPFAGHKVLPQFGDVLAHHDATRRYAPRIKFHRMRKTSRNTWRYALSVTLLSGSNFHRIGMMPTRSRYFRASASTSISKAKPGISVCEKMRSAAFAVIALNPFWVSQTPHTPNV